MLSNEMLSNLTNLAAGTRIVSTDGITFIVLHGAEQPANKNSVVEAKNLAVQEHIKNFWARQMDKIRQLSVENLKHFELPVARVKKIMKLDDEVGMIRSEAPFILARASEMFVEELTLRSWIETAEKKRRTLQRADIAIAASKCEQYDFLTDIIPGDEFRRVKPPSGYSSPPASKSTAQPVSEVQLDACQERQLKREGTPTNSAPSLPEIQAPSATIRQTDQPETLSCMMNSIPDFVQQANLNLSSDQVDAIHQYIVEEGFPITFNQIVFQVPTSSENPQQSYVSTENTHDEFFKFD